MRKKLKYLLTLTLAFAGVFIFCFTANAAQSEFRADDDRQMIVLKTTMPDYTGSSGYAIHILGFLINITSGSNSKTVFLEGDISYHQLRYSAIISEFNTEHGSGGKTLAENYFYNGTGTMTLDTVMTLWQKGGGYSSSYDDFKCVKAGQTGWVQAKINDSSNVLTPSKEVSASNWKSQIKNFPVKFWNWSAKSHAWSSYASRMNSAKTSVYTLNPSTFTADTVKNYSAPYYAADWQNAAMMCEFDSTSVLAIREYYKRTIVRQNTVNFKVSEIEAPSSMTDYCNVNVLYTNEHYNRGVQKVPVSLSLTGGDTIAFDLEMDTNNYSGCLVTYTIYGYTSGSQTLKASINGGINGSHKYTESTYSDNEKTKSITVNTSKDFGVWGLSVENSEIYENDIIAVSVNWTNYKMGSYSNVPAQIYIGGTLAYTDYLNFSGYETISRTYYLNVGSGTGIKQILARINWSGYLSESDPNDNQTSITITVREYYEFSISNLSVSPSSVYQNEAVTVSLRTDNWNYTKAYSNIPVQVLYDGTVVKTDYVSFSAYGVNYHTYTINAGSSIGTHTVSARINWSNRNSEVDPNNNQTETKTVSVQASTNLQIEHVNTYGDYREGTEVITTFRVKNIGNEPILPGKNLKVKFDVSHPNFQTQQKTQVVIPANSDNLVYFKWTVPNGTAGQVLMLTATVNPDNAVSEISTSDNYVVVSKRIVAADYSATPDTRFEKSAPYDFYKTSPPNNAGITNVSWSEWVYENGSFVKKTYGLQLNTGIFEIVPDANSPSRRYQNGYWYMGSGYGFSLKLAVYTSTASGTNTPPASSYTSAQTSKLLLPEYKYSIENGKYRSLSRTSTNIFELPNNPNALNNGRIHFVPLWFPDGEYIGQACVTDLWTPAGMMTMYINSNAIMISKSAYDDWYVR